MSSQSSNPSFWPHPLSALGCCLSAMIVLNLLYITNMVSIRLYWYRYIQLSNNHYHHIPRKAFEKNFAAVWCVKLISNSFPKVQKVVSTGRRKCNFVSYSSCYLHDPTPSIHLQNQGGSWWAARRQKEASGLCDTSSLPDNQLQQELAAKRSRIHCQYTLTIINILFNHGRK